MKINKRNNIIILTLMILILISASGCILSEGTSGTGGENIIAGAVMEDDNTVTEEPAPSAEPITATEEPSPVPTQTSTPAPIITAAPTPEPTAVLTPTPTIEPTPEPTPEPTAKPTPEPTPVPTEEPTPLPTPVPTVQLTPNPITAPDTGGVKIIALDKEAEYIIIKNPTTEPVDMTGWWILSVLGEQKFHFPSGYTLAPGQECKVAGFKANGTGDFNWEEGRGIWNNSKTDDAALYNGDELADYWED